jgi:hypothetical protein
MGPRVTARLFCDPLIGATHRSPLLLSILNYRTAAANCSFTAAPPYVGVECPAALFHLSAQPKPSMLFGWLFIMNISLVIIINGALFQFALYHQRGIMRLYLYSAFAFPAVPHFNNQYLCFTCPSSHTSIRAQLSVRDLRHIDIQSACAPMANPALICAGAKAHSSWYQEGFDWGYGR